MLKLKFWEDVEKKEDGYYYHCCSVDDSEVNGFIDTWYRESNYDIAKEKMLENLKRLRDDIDDLIRRESSENKIYDKVKNWFKNNSTINNGEQYDIIEYDGNLEVRTKTIIFIIVAPFAPDDRWMLKISTMSAFEQWENSTAVEEFFDTDVELCNCLIDYQLNIYKKLLEYLSEEYYELEEYVNDYI